MVFRLSKKAAAEILVSEAVGVAIGLPLAGTAASLTFQTLDRLLSNTAEFRAPDAPGLGADEFLNQFPLALQGLYDREPLLRSRLLYVEEVNFVDRLVETGRVDIEITPDHRRFALTPFADPGTEALRDQGFERLLEVQKYTHDSQIIRTHRIEATPQGARLHVQRATYKDQARSNLILDFTGDGRAPSLREALRRENPGFLPALTDRRLVNSLGVTCLVFYRDEDGSWTPFLVPRTAKTAVMNHRLWSDSASGAAEWPDHPEEVPETFEAYILDDLHRELKDEIGLDAADLIAILPLAIGRELIRAGKPQMFFVGFTALTRRELLAGMGAARAKARKNPIEPEEIYAMPLLRKPPKPGNVHRLPADYEGKGVDPQCAASLYYALTFLKALESRGDDWLA